MLLKAPYVPLRTGQIKPQKWEALLSMQPLNFKPTHTWCVCKMPRGECGCECISLTPNPPVNAYLAASACASKHIRSPPQGRLHPSWGPCLMDALLTPTFQILPEQTFRRGWTWTKRGKGREETRSLGFLPSSLQPRTPIILPLAPIPPPPVALPCAPSLRSRRERRGRRLKPPPATAWKSCSCKKKKKSCGCHLPRGVRMAHFCRLVFGPRGRCGGWLRGADARWRPGNRARGGGRGVPALRRQPVRLAPGLGCRRPWAPATRSLPGPHPLAVSTASRLLREERRQAPRLRGSQGCAGTQPGEAQLLALLLGP